jgi:uncharacterized protein
VGYGLESKLTDAQASRIVHDVAIPRLRAGDRDGAVVGTVDSILGLLGGEVSPGAQPSAVMPRPGGFNVAKWVLIGIAVLVFLVLLLRYPSLALYLLASLASSGRRGGGGSGGSGFSGGGGRSGGGGAGGSW